MTAAIVPVQHGVRYTWPGNRTASIDLCVDRDTALTLMDDLAASGVTRMELVRRTVPAWEIDADGLPTMIRHLAEARVDEQLDDGDVRAQLAMWLAGQDVEGHAITRTWQLLVAAIRDQIAADDDGRTPDVADAEKRIAEAVHELVGGG